MKSLAKLESQIFQSLAHPKRVEIVHLLSKGPLTVSELVEMLGVSQANVSQHLMVMRKLGLVSSTVDKQQRIYELTSSHVSKLSHAVRHILLLRNGVKVEEELHRLHFHTDPVCGMEVTSHMAASSAVVNGKRYYFCATGCEKKFLQNNESQKIKGELV
jgi:DNA-binding transcriptional ArsR family regulator/YHS domain-containing protein